MAEQLAENIQLVLMHCLYALSSMEMWSVLVEETLISIRHLGRTTLSDFVTIAICSFHAELNLGSNGEKPELSYLMKLDNWIYELSC